MIAAARWRKASTRERCIALYPGSNPGRASKSTIFHLYERRKCRLIAPLKAFRSCGIWSKDHARARLTRAPAQGTRGTRALFLCPNSCPRDLMPKRTDISTILIIGAGPIVIGQACEFDYSGTQAVKTLKDEGYRIVLVNSNPATIMTDPELADATYIEPITPEIVAKII